MSTKRSPRSRNTEVCLSIAGVTAAQKELPTANFTDYAAVLGLNTSEFGTCLTADSELAKVKADVAVATALKVDSTPTLFIGRMRKEGGVDLLRRVRGVVPASVLMEEVAKLKS